MRMDPGARYGGVVAKGKPGEFALNIQYQQTLKNHIRCTGIGLHSGAKVDVTMRPAPPDTGIVFQRMEGPDVERIDAEWDNVSDTTLCTTISNDAGVKVATIEHLMAALMGCGIDNVVIQIDGPEVPAMDGSAAPFVFLIECAGVATQNAPRRALRVLREVEVRDGDRYARLEPGVGFSVDLEIAFDNALVARQRCSFVSGNGAFKSELSRSRTFGFEQEVEQLRALGLARGGSLDNAVVISGDRVLNDGGLRYDDEFVRHKILDLIGDLYLAGRPIEGHFKGFCSGHGLNNRLLRRLMADRAAWRIVMCESAANEWEPEPAAANA